MSVSNALNSSGLLNAGFLTASQTINLGNPGDVTAVVSPTQAGNYLTATTNAGVVTLGDNFIQSGLSLTTYDGVTLTTNVATVLTLNQTLYQTPTYFTNNTGENSVYLSSSAPSGKYLIEYQVTFQNLQSSGTMVQMFMYLNIKVGPSYSPNGGSYVGWSTERQYDAKTLTGQIVANLSAGQSAVQLGAQCIGGSADVLQFTPQSPGSGPGDEPTIDVLGTPSGGKLMLKYLGP